jgi:ABC-2 type transport system permease protein
LSADQGIDLGAIAGSYIGLLLLSAVFASIAVCCSSFTSNPVVAFISAAFFCFFLYNGFKAVSLIPSFAGVLDYYVEMLGIDFHYHNISRGVIDTRDLLYFLSIICICLGLTQRNLSKQ